MHSNLAKTKLVRIKIEEDKTGVFFATSPDVKGLLVAKPTIEDLYADIPRAIEELYALCGVDVIVAQVGDDDVGDHPWVAIPADVARQRLDAKAD